MFSHPPIGTIGLTEAGAKPCSFVSLSFPVLTVEGMRLSCVEAIDKYGEDAITKYTSTFVNMYYSPWEMPPAEKPKSYVKMICTGEEQKVVGLHIIGMAADEMVCICQYTSYCGCTPSLPGFVCVFLRYLMSCAGLLSGNWG